MKKIFSYIAAFGMLVASSEGFLFVNWSGPSGFVLPDGITPIVPDPASALVQLIFSPDAIAGDALPGGGASGDIILAEAFTSEALTGNPYGAAFSYIYGPAPDLVGYLYVRVFEAGTSPGVVPVGTWYFTGPMFPTVFNPGPPTVPDDVHAGLGGEGPGPYGTFILNQQVVPEPSVLALAALGAAVVAVRRFRRS